MNILKGVGVVVVLFFVWKAYDAGGIDGVWDWFDGVMTTVFDWIKGATDKAEDLPSNIAPTTGEVPA